MFYELDLDDRTYHEIESDAVFQIPREYPEWTNYNPADPGVTLVQLLSWLTEVQQYHLSQVDSCKRRKFLKLLGAGIRYARPAEGAVSASPGLELAGQEIALPVGSRFYAEDMAFETVEPVLVYPIRLIGAYISWEDRWNHYYNIDNEMEKQIRLYPFGEEPRVGDQCYFLLDRPLSSRYPTDMYFEISTGCDLERNPVSEDFISLAALEWEYQTADGWEPMEPVYDETHELLFSGRIRFFPEKEMEADRELGVYRIRVTLRYNDYDVAPLIRSVRVNEIPVRQQYTCCDYEDHTARVLPDGKTCCIDICLYLANAGKAELYLKTEEGWLPWETEEVRSLQGGAVRIFFRKPEWEWREEVCRLMVCEEEWAERRVLGNGNAFANQEYRLYMPDLLYDEFEIMVRDGKAGVYQSYRKTEDFDTCTPESLVYILDPEAQTIRFGDCERGQAPDGEIRLIRLRTSLGSMGNIKADKIKTCDTLPQLIVKQYRPTMGGRDNEALSRCFERVRRELDEINRGVTYADYETLARKAPGLLIVDSRVIAPDEWDEGGENRITIVVQPLSLKKRSADLSRRYRENLMRVLNRRKMLGTSVRLLAPVYIGISVYAEIAILPQFKDAEEQIETAVRSFIDDRTWKIGSPVLSSVIYGIIDTLPCVRQVRTLTLDGRGKGCRRLPGGDVSIPPNGLAWLENLDYSIRTVDLR
ncbi:MAG: baseplate J/gp47 family protein [Lachnospiraceae bacterium]|nr:baseplate J/gp47 family protein [Lachnospiraceae bacterium]